MRVVLPDPFGPTIAVTLPESIEWFTSCNATVLPNCSLNLQSLSNDLPHSRFWIGKCFGCDCRNYTFCYIKDSNKQTM